MIGGYVSGEWTRVLQIPLTPQKIPTGHKTGLQRWQPFHRSPGGRKVMHDGSLKSEAYLYHMLSWPYAERILEERRLRLAPVRCWDDPYEKWWCDLLFDQPGPLVGIQAYGLCWTTGRYDEPRWRMAGFRKSDPVVRIRCRAGALLEAGRGLIEATSGALFLGKVLYLGESKLQGLAKSFRAGTRKHVTRTAASLLLHKRSAFKFEQEVRLIWLDREPRRDAFYIPIDAAVIDQVMTSPHDSWDQHSRIKAKLEPRGIECKRSGILRAPRPH